MLLSINEIDQAIDNLFTILSSQDLLELDIAEKQIFKTYPSFFHKIQYLLKTLIFSKEKKKLLQKKESILNIFYRSINLICSHRIICEKHQQTKEKLSSLIKLFKNNKKQKSFLSTLFPSTSLNFSIPYHVEFTLLHNSYEQNSLSHAFIPLKKKVDLSNLSTITPTKHEIDAFRTKGISLIQENKISSSIPEILKILKKSPIHSTKLSKDIISLKQTFSSFPGEMIQLHGAFKRKPFQSFSIPITESFKIFTNASQTGFPHPSQHTGWAFNHYLLPDTIIRIDKLNYFPPLLRNKHDLAQALLPNGYYNSKAKNLLKLKKEAFNQNLNHFVKLYKSFYQKICSNPFKEILEIIKTKKNPYETLSSYHQIINDLFISRPYHHFLNQWIIQSNSALREKEQSRRLEKARAILEKEFEKIYFELQKKIKLTKNLEEQHVLHFILSFGKTLSSSIKTIFLRNFSEKVEYQPKPLTLFDQKIEACAISQLLSFHQSFLFSIPKDPIAFMANKMTDQINEETHIFSATSIKQIPLHIYHIVQELDLYFRKNQIKLNTIN